MGSSPVTKSLINIVVVYRTFNPGTRVRFPHQAGFLFFSVILYERRMGRTYVAEW